MKPGWLESVESTTVPQRLDAIFLDIITAAQGLYPTVRVPYDVFVAYLGDRLPEGIPLPFALRQIHRADLPGLACASGDIHALIAFDAHCLRQVERVPHCDQGWELRLG